MEDDYNGSKQQQHDESDEMVVDPTMFLERTADEGEYMVISKFSIFLLKSF